MSIFDDGDPLNLSDCDELNAYLSRDVSAPQIPTAAEFARLSDRAIEALNADRLDFVRTRMTVSARALKETVGKTKRAIWLNKGVASGRKGVIVTGRATTGKTTACLAAMRTVWFDYQIAHPDSWSTATPVAYVTVPPDCTRKGLMRRFADFYQVEYGERTSADELRQLMVEEMRVRHTMLTAVDEMQNLSVERDKSGTISVDTLKDLANSPYSTYLYAGAEVKQLGLLSGPRGQQLAGRCAKVVTTPYRFATTADRAQWRELVKGFANALPLVANTPSELVRHSPWLHKVTAGSISTLHMMLSQGVLTVIERDDPQNETLTRDVLEDVVLDGLAEERLHHIEDPFDLGEEGA